jgi:endonuclease YncB( thermonuclease family)
MFICPVGLMIKKLMEFKVKVLLTIIGAVLASFFILNQENPTKREKNSLPLPQRELIYGKVIKILDGDTIVIKENLTQRIERIRFEFIDAPEKDQKSFDGVPIGINSKNFLHSLITDFTLKSHLLRVRPNLEQLDPYGRIIGSVFPVSGELHDKNSLNFLMVRNGQAFLYQFNSYSSKFQKNLFHQALYQAYLTKSGIFATAGTLNPSHYRKRKYRAFPAKDDSSGLKKN